MQLARELKLKETKIFYIGKDKYQIMKVGEKNGTKKNIE